MNIKRNYLIITAIAFLLFICLSVSVYQLTARLHQEQNLSYTASAETIYVYDTNNDVNSIEPSEKKWNIQLGRRGAYTGHRYAYKNPPEQRPSSASRGI